MFHNRGGPHEPDELRDDEYPDEDDSDDEESSTIPCPQCGAEIYEDAVRCPRCGTYVTVQTSPWSGRSAWWIILGVLGVAAALWALFHAPGW